MLNQARRHSMDFKFGTYNLLEGGCDHGDRTRFYRQMRRLAAQDANAWALQECSEWDTNGCLEAAEDALGMKGFIAQSNKNPRGNVGIFVKVNDYRVKVIRTRHEGMFHKERVQYWHAVAVAYVDVMGFGMLQLASAHLAPISPDKRAEEAEFIGLLAEKEIPLIIGMDANAYALNEPRRDTTGVHEGKARRKSDLRAAAALAEYMTDTGEYAGDTTPTVGFTRNDKLEYICDRVYTTLPKSTIIDHEVVTDEDEDSDHRKAKTTFRLDTGD
jgi:endonuclease/exonuclease/phosphatase family metal-dependent hydrolase